MSSSLVIANFKTGLENDKESHLMDNDAFPTLNNAFLFRKKIIKKRGSLLLNRLERQVTAGALGNTSAGGVVSLGLIATLSLPASSSIAPGTITVTIGAQAFTEPTIANGTLSNGAGGTGTINYATGALVVNTNPVLAATAATITFQYFPNLPVMGLEDFLTSTINFPVLVAFDTTKSYQFNETTQTFYDVNFYKSSAKSFLWSGTDAQQFWTTNYAGAMWATNGVPGMNFKVMVTWARVDATHATINIVGHGLVVNDWIWVNEATETVAGEFNLKSGIVTAVTDANNVVVLFAAAAFGVGDNGAGGIAQYMTSSIAGKDGIKWYDGDPVVSAAVLGWVNFAPPLANVAAPTYLVGANMIVPFQGRLLFFGVWEQTSGGAPIYYGNKMYACQDGTPYYSNPVPTNFGVQVSSWYSNITGFGYRLGAPVPQQIVGIGQNEDVLLADFEGRKLRLLFTANSTEPFVWQTINTELNGQSTFSTISLDQGMLSMGSYGIALTTQVAALRIDLQIPDEIFSVSAANSGNARVTAIRDYRQQIVYFTYPTGGNYPSTGTQKYPAKTLAYNYLENNWATFDENYTTYGNYRRTTGYTWATLPFKTWASWTTPWNFGSLGQRYPFVIGGNQQGFVMIRDEVGTREGASQYISAISGVTITSPNHNLSPDDVEYIEILAIVGNPDWNGEIYKVQAVDADTFTLLPTETQDTPSGTYLGGGVYRRLTNINILSKQFPISWEGGRQTRLGTQKYLCDTTSKGEITVSLYTNENDNTPSNDPLSNAYQPFTNVLLTRDEPDNPFSQQQNQIWHRVSTPVIGSTLQVGFTLSDAQMRDEIINQSEIGISAIVMDLYPGPVLS